MQMTKKQMNSKIKKYSKFYFTYKEGYWRDQVLLHKQDSYEVAKQFATMATRVFNEAVKHVVEKNRNYLRIAGALVAIDRQAISLARASDGIEEHYRLSDFWCRSILLHQTVDDAKRDGLEDKAINNLRGIFGILGWDFDEAYYTKFDEIRTTLKVIFSYIPEEFITPHMTDEEIKEFQIVGELDLVLEPTHPYPIGAEYESKSGNIWKVCFYSSNSIMCEPNIEHKDGTYKPLPFSEKRIDGWKRLV